MNARSVGRCAHRKVSSKKRRIRAVDSAAYALEPLESRTLLNALTWSAGTSLPAALGNAAAVSTPTGIYLFGGTTGSAAPTAVYELDPNSGAWVASQPIDQGRAGLGAAATGRTGPSGSDGPIYASDIFLFGGVDQGVTTNTAFNYEPVNTGNDQATPPSMLTARSQFAYTVDPNTGDLYAIGGIGSNGATLSSAEIYDPNADAWSAIAPLPVALHGEAATSDGIGDILVFGGATANGTPSDAVYAYNISTGTWSVDSTMPFAASGVSLVNVAYGQIYVIGGQTSGGATANVEVFNPVTDQWDTETSLPTALYGAAAALDLNGNVVVMGGFNAAGQALSSVYTSPAGPAPVGLPVDANIQPYGYATYNGTPQSMTGYALTTDGSQFVDGTFSFTYNGSGTPPTDAGTYNVVATFTSNDPNYLSNVTGSTFYISQATPTLTVTGGGTITYDGNPHPITATQVGVDGVTPVSGSLTYTYNGSTSPPVNAGVYTAVATFTSSDPNYASTSATTTITIPNPYIPTGVKVTGISTTAVKISWNAAPVPVAGYDVYEKYSYHSPRGSGGGTYYVLIASGVTGTSITHTGAGTFAVASISPTGVISARSADASGAVLSAPYLYGATLNGALLSTFPVTIGQTLHVQLISTGNLPPTYSIVSGAPATMSVDAATGLVTYTPNASEVGNLFSVTFQATNSVGSSQNTFWFQVNPAPAATNFQVNDGNPQRSMVQSLTVTFNQQVILGGGAITLTQRETGTAETFALSNPSGDLKTYVLTFTDPSYVGASLPDGVYDLTVHAALVLGYPGNATPPADQTFSFYRLYGDFTGSGSVGFGSLVQIIQDYNINSSNPNYLSYMDIDGDGVINFAELVGVIQNFGKALSVSPPPAGAATSSVALAAAPAAAATANNVVGINQIFAPASSEAAPAPANDADSAILSGAQTILN